MTESVKSLFEVNKYEIKRRTPFNRLFLNNPEAIDLIDAYIWTYIPLYYTYDVIKEQTVIKTLLCRHNTATEVIHFEFILTEDYNMEEDNSI